MIRSKVLRPVRHKIGHFGDVFVLEQRTDVSTAGDVTPVTVEDHHQQSVASCPGPKHSARYVGYDQLATCKTITLYTESHGSLAYRLTASRRNWLGGRTTRKVRRPVQLQNSSPSFAAVLKVRRWKTTENWPAIVARPDNSARYGKDRSARNQRPDLQNILAQSYDYLTIMSKLRSTYDIPGRSFSTFYVNIVSRSYDKLTIILR